MPAKKGKSNIKTKNLEGKMDFVVDFLQTKVALKEDLNKVENRLSTVETKLDKVENRLSTVETKLSGTETSVANLAKLVKDYHQEMIMFTRKVERMETWIKKVSAKIGVPYDF